MVRKELVGRGEKQDNLGQERKWERGEKEKRVHRVVSREEDGTAAGKVRSSVLGILRRRVCCLVHRWERVCV